MRRVPVLEEALEEDRGHPVSDEENDDDHREPPGATGELRCVLTISPKMEELSM
jgi:hypothetical protein